MSDYDELEHLMRDLENKKRIYTAYINKNLRPPIELIASIDSLQRSIASLKRLIVVNNKSRRGSGR
jgi:hypothetical protein